MSLPDMEKNSTGTPGRPSGVWSRDVTPPIPASQPQAIIDVAKPVATEPPHGPVLVDGRNDQPAGPHLEGFSEGVLNFYIIDVHLHSRPLIRSKIFVRVL